MNCHEPNQVVRFDSGNNTISIRSELTFYSSKYIAESDGLYDLSGDKMFTFISNICSHCQKKYYYKKKKRTLLINTLVYDVRRSKESKNDDFIEYDVIFNLVITGTSS